MNIAKILVSRYRLTITAALLFALVGAASWFTMPQQEDPTMPYRAASIVIPYPGADAETVEARIIDPLEQRLAQVQEIDIIRATARANVAVIVVQLREDVLEGVDRAWDDVERKLQLAEVDFPDAAQPAQFDRDMFDQESIVLAVGGNNDLLHSRDDAIELERRLLRLDTVSRIVRSGDPGEQLTVTLHPSTTRRLGIDARVLADILARRNSAIPGGTIASGGRTITLRPGAEFESVEQLRDTPISLASGAAVQLRDIADVELTVQQPVQQIARRDGEAVVMLGIVPRQRINVMAFGEDVEQLVATFREESRGTTVEFVAFQPARVKDRIESLGRSLLSGVLIVALVVIVLMGPRLGVTVASVVPLVAMVSLALYALGGGVLQQMSIAALVLALGLLVDNAIVVAENIQFRIDGGAERWQAAEDAVRELALPLGAATGTTLAAFVPMLLSEGATGDFTRALPIVIMVTLSVSYVFAITFTPAVSAIVLRPRQRGAGPLDKFFRQLSRPSVRTPWIVLLVIAGLLAVSLSQLPKVGLQFFPASDRNQVVVDVRLPEGTHLSQTLEAVEALESALLPQSNVVSVSSFVGRGVPHFYYNLVQKPRQPHGAQLLVTTRSSEDVADAIAFIRDTAHDVVPGVEVIARRIEQGPPVTAPIEIRLYGESFADLGQASDAILLAVRQSDGTIDARHTLGQGSPTIDLAIHDDVAARHGVSRDDVALALLGSTHGLSAGDYRAGVESSPIIVRGPHGEQTPVDLIPDTDVTRPGGQPVPISQLATVTVTSAPASIDRRNARRVVSVLAQLQDGATYSGVMDELQSTLEEIVLPTGVNLEIGGEAEGSGDANAALLTTFPVGLLLLLLFLMGEFNSFRGVAIVMTTVPLAAVGVIPGLAWGGQPFGFMSMLGVFALVGIVVNNAIVLLDVIGNERGEGRSVAQAIEAAVAQRTRPILLTTATTVAGLMPLALSSSTFWPPLALSMISGLVASTALTLFAVPSLYRILHKDR